MWRLTHRLRIRKELQELLGFLKGFFGNEIQAVIIYGSFLRWSFRKDSDVDMAIILHDSPEWRWSSSDLFWDARNDSPHRKDFFLKWGETLQKLDNSHPYDLKIFTVCDLGLLEEFQNRIVHARGNLVSNIKNGKVIFKERGDTWLR